MLKIADSPADKTENIEKTSYRTQHLTIEINFPGEVFIITNSN
jgi:hypothetical protein